MRLRIGNPWVPANPGRIGPGNANPDENVGNRKPGLRCGHYSGRPGRGVYHIGSAGQTAGVYAGLGKSYRHGPAVHRHVLGARNPNAMAIQ